MIYPSIDRLITKVDSKYTLVIAAAKRARQLNEHSRPLIESELTKSVSIALEEIVQDKVTYERTKAGIK